MANTFCLSFIEALIALFVDRALEKCGLVRKQLVFC